MQKRNLLIIVRRQAHIIIFLLILLLYPITLLHAQKSFKHVLFIGSYSLTFPQSLPAIKGIQDTFIGTHIAMDAEFMDSKTFSDSTDVASFKLRLEYKLRKIPKYDAIILSDDNAFNFVLDNQNTLFKNIPILFIGVNNKEKALEQKKNPWIRGIVENISFKENIDLMLKLFPHQTRVYAICDPTLSGKEGERLFKSYYSQYKNIHFEVISLKDYNYCRFFKKLESIQPNNPVLFLTAYKDKEGIPMSFDEASSAIKAHLKAPLFYVLRFGIGHGAIGGKMLNFYDQGKIVANMVKEILLKGKSISQMKILTDSPNQYLFDYRELKKYNIDFDLLPEGSTIYYRPISIVETHKELFLTIFIAFIILLSFIVLLIISNTKCKHIAEQLTIAKEKAEEGDKIKTEFIHNLSHELKTPLNGIMGFTELLSSNPDKMKENEQYKNIILTCSKQLYRIVNDIIEISRLETRQVNVIEEKTNLNNLLQNLYYIFEETAKKKGLKFTIQKALSDKDCLIVTDSSKLIKIISNLLDNAFKYTEDGFIHFGYSVEKDILIFFVEDSGVGIPAGKQQIIFKRFEQADQKLSRKFDGLGLGLSIANENTILLKGKITLKSESGKGTTFYVNIPYKKAGK